MPYSILVSMQGEGPTMFWKLATSDVGEWHTISGLWPQLHLPFRKMNAVSMKKNVNRTESCQMARPGSTNYPPVWLGVWEWSPSNSRNWWWFARPLKCLWLPSFERRKGVGYWRQVGSWVGSRGCREMWLETHLCNLHSEMEILIEGSVIENRNWV